MQHAVWPPSISPDVERPTWFASGMCKILIPWQMCGFHRWSDKMEGPRQKKDHWRKSGQWFALTQQHAQLVVSDTEVAKAFKE